MKRDDYRGEASSEDASDESLSLDRREIVAGLAAGVALAAVPARAATTTAANIRFVRNPARHNQFGIVIEYAPTVSEQVALVLYPSTFGGTDLPDGFAQGKRAYQELDSFTFNDARFSDRGKYRIAFAVSLAEGRCKIKASFNREGQRTVEAIKGVDLVKFARGEEGLEFVLTTGHAEFFRWDLFGERLEVKGTDGAVLTLKLASPVLERGGLSPWSEPQLDLTLAPHGSSTIWAIKGSVAVKTLRIRKTQGDQGDGARIQEVQELEGFQAGDLGRHGRYRAAAWIGEASELIWRFPKAKDDSSDKDGKKERTRAKKEKEKEKEDLVSVPYDIGDATSPRRRAAIQIAHDDAPTKLTLRQWGQPRQTLAVLRGPLKVTILGATTAEGRTPPPAIFHLADAILTRQDREDAVSARPGDNPHEKFDETITGRLQDKAFSVDTPYGSLIVEGDPPPVKEPPANKGEEQKKNGTQAGAPGGEDKSAADKPKPSSNPLGRRFERPVDFAERPEKGLTQFQLRAKRGVVQFFDARALLRHMSVALPDATPSTAEPPAASIDNEIKPAVWSRLDFDGTEIAFRLHLPEIAQTWPSARGIVTLGEAPRELVSLSVIAKEANEESAGDKARGASGRPKKPEPRLPAPIAIALDGARLRARRDSDNFALTFGFARMVLELGLGGGRIVPNASVSGAGAGLVTGIDSARRGFDDRPLLIVNFPPQHVAEKVYYRQIADGVTLPDVPRGIEGDVAFANELDRWRKAQPADKSAVRESLFTQEKTEIASATGEVKVAIGRLKDLIALLELRDNQAEWTAKLKLAAEPEKFKALWDRWSGLPQDQRYFYLGPSARAMDPDVRSVLLDIWRVYLANNPGDPAGQPVEPAETAFNEQLTRLPDVDIEPAVENDLAMRLPDSGNEGVARRDGTKYSQTALNEKLIAEKRRRSHDFEKVADAYAKLHGTSNPPLDKAYSGRKAILDAWRNNPAARVSIDGFVRTVAAKYEEQAFEQKFGLVTPARLSGPSRLVFRFDSSGGSYDDQDRDKRSRLGEDKEKVRSIHFSFEGLTDWGRFDLAVMRRAETLEIPLGGRVPHPNLRAVDLDAARILAHQGIQPGRSIAGRMADIRAGLRAPEAHETAIELPFRLVLSPDQFGRFRTRRPIAPGVLRDDTPKPAKGEKKRARTPTALWSANLQISDVKPVVRAVWSDDFRPLAIGDGASPLRGPHAAWAEPPGTSDTQPPEFRTALDAFDRHEIVALSSVFGMPVMGRRDELDSLLDASQFEPPADYKLKGLKYYGGEGKKDRDLSGIYNPSSLDVAELRLTALGGSLRHDTGFTPPASALLKDGKNIFEAFSVERWRQITVLGRDIEVEVVYKGFLFPLGVRAALVKLTERRFIRQRPDGPVTAFLIQRKFIRIGKKTKTFPATGNPDSARRFPASEITMLTLETPDIVDPDVLNPAPLTQFVPKTSPPLDKLWFGVRANGAIDFCKSDQFKPNDLLPGLCFWPRIRPSAEGNFGFEFRVEGDAAPLRMPMVFVDNRAANNKDTMAALAAYYNWDVKTDDGQSDADKITPAQRSRRTVIMAGARRRYADENQDGECHFETYEWELKAEGRREAVRVPDGQQPPAYGSPGSITNTFYESDPLLQGSDQPPFYPFIHRAKIRIGQAERFVGRSLEPRYVSFVDAYRVSGFPSRTDANAGTNQLERYLKLEKTLELEMGEAGDRSGGIGRPAMHVGYLSRRHGLMPDVDIPQAPPTQPVATPPADGPSNNVAPEPQQPAFKLDEFFNGNAKLLGLLTFKDLLAAAGSAMPELKEKVDAATEDTAAFLKQTVLPEIEHALEKLKEMWETARRTLTSQAARTRDVVSLDIDKVYPDIAPALTGLIDKVEKAQRASGLDLVAAMSEVQTSGRQFVSAVNRTLADPVAPLREDLRGKFRIISEQISKFGDDINKFAEKVINALIVGLADQFKTAIRNALIDKIDLIKPFTRLLFSLPIPADQDVLKTRADVAGFLDTAAAHGAIAFTSDLLATGSLEQADIDRALKKGLEAARTELDKARSAAVAEAKPIINAYWKEADDLLKEATAELSRRLRGVAFAELFGNDGVARELQKTGKAIVKDIKESNGKDLLEIIARHVAAALKEMARPLIESSVNQLCETLAGRFSTVADRILIPAGDSPAAGRVSLETLLKTLESVVKTLGMPDAELPKAPVIERYAKIRKKLTAQAAADYCTDASKTALSALAANQLSELLALKTDIATLLATTLEQCETAVLNRRADIEANTQSLRDKLWAFFARSPTEPLKDLPAQLAELIGAAAIDPLDQLIGSLPVANPADTSPFGQLTNQWLVDLKKNLESVRATFQAAKNAIENAKNQGPLDAVRVLLIVLDGIETDQGRRRLSQLPQAVQAELNKQLELLKGGIRAAAREAEAKIERYFGQVLAAEKTAKTAAINALGRAFAPIFATLREKIYGQVLELRTAGRQALEQGQSRSAVQQIVNMLMKTLRGPGGVPLSGLFSVPPVENDANRTDRLDKDIARLTALETVADPNTYLSDLTSLIGDWQSGNASPLVLLRNVRFVLTAVLKGDLAQFVDLHQIRREVDEAIRRMVPARIKRSYDLKLRMKNLGNLVLFEGGGSKLGLPRPHPKGLPGTLVLRATGVVDVLQPKNSTVDAEGYLPGFALQLLPSFDVVTFTFPPTTFTAGLGKPFHIALKVDDVQLGSKVQFLKDIQSILPAPKNGKGFFIRMLKGRGSLGIVAGYAFPVSPITIGNMFIDNLSLNVAAELPFDKGDARFVVSVSRPEAPFMIAAAPYAGAGHFGLIANPKGIIGFEASFQFGGGGGFSFGPLTGKGRISVGIFVRKIQGLTELYGIFYAGGSARIACFGVGAELNVRMSQAGGSVEGEAIFTYSFSIGIKDIEFSVAVFKRESGSSSGDQGSLDDGRTIDLTAEDFREVYAQDSGTASLVSAKLRCARIRNMTLCKAENYEVYRRYFSEPGAPKPSPAKPAAAKPVRGRAASAGRNAHPQVHAEKPRKVWVMS